MASSRTKSRIYNENILGGLTHLLWKSDAYVYMRHSHVSKSAEQNDIKISD